MTSTANFANTINAPGKRRFTRRQTPLQAIRWADSCTVRSIATQSLPTNSSRIWKCLRSLAPNRRELAQLPSKFQTVHVLSSQQWKSFAHWLRNRRGAVSAQSSTTSTGSCACCRRNRRRIPSAPTQMPMLQPRASCNGQFASREICAKKMKQALKVGPGGVLLRRVENGGDEFHAGYAVIDGRDEERVFCGGTACVVSRDLLRDVGVKLSEGFEVAFRMAARNAARMFGRSRGIGAVARQSHRRLAVTAEVHVVGIFLRPIDAALFAVDAEAEIVFVTDGDLAGPEHAADSFVVAEQDLNVVVETAAGNHDADVGGDLFGVMLADEAGDVVSVRADVAKRAGGSALRGVGAPRGLFLAGVFERRGEPILRVFDLHEAKLAEFAGSDHFARLTNDGVAGVVVCETENFAGFFDQLRESLRVFDGGREWLVADDVEAGFEKGFCGAEVEMIRRDDRDGVDAIGALRFGGGHFGEAAVRSVRGDVEIARGGASALGTRGESGGDEFPAIVDARGDAMDGGDDAAGFASFYAEAMAAGVCRCCFCVDGHVSPRVLFFPAEIVIVI